MDFLERKSIMKRKAKEGGRKRPREGDSSATATPLTARAVDTSGRTPSEAPDSTALAVEITAGDTAFQQLVMPTAAGDEPVNPLASASDRPRADADLDLELSLRQKRTHDVDVGEKITSKGKSPECADKPEMIDARTNEGGVDGFEVVAHVDKGKPRGSTNMGQSTRNDNASSSDGGTYGFARSLHNSGHMTGDSDIQADTNPCSDKIVRSTTILPANQGETLFDSARMHGLNVDMEGLEHDIEQRAEDDRRIDSTRLPPEGSIAKTARDPGSSSTPDTQLAFKELGDRILAAFDEQRRILDEQRKMMELVLANQTVAGTSAELAQGLIYDLRTLMSRSPYKGTLNLAFCGLMVAARLGHLTPFILDDPVVQILLGDHIEELRHVINSVVPYQHSVFPGPH